METKIALLHDFLQQLWPPAAIRRGKPHRYSWPSLVLFFLIMLLKHIHRFKTMATYARAHHRCFGWSSPPSRQTLTRRFQALPALIHRLMPLVAQAASKREPSRFSFRWAFIDKSVFRAKGGVWHRAQRLLGLVPHSSIDTDASWAKSSYHGWRFGYGLHLVCNAHRFPLACTVTTASTKDTTQLIPLLARLVHQLGLVVADKGYVALALLQKLTTCWHVFVLLPTCFKAKKQWQQHYNQLATTPQARLLYRQRKTTIEPVFALIKEIFQLSAENQLPYRGLHLVKPYLMLAAFSVQMLMLYNYLLKQHNLASTQLFLSHFK